VETGAVFGARAATFLCCRSPPPFYGKKNSSPRFLSLSLSLSLSRSLSLSLSG